jgi:hypothetical protein
MLLYVPFEEGVSFKSIDEFTKKDFYLSLKIYFLKKRNKPCSKRLAESKSFGGFEVNNFKEYFFNGSRL